LYFKFVSMASLIEVYILVFIKKFDEHLKSTVR
jgi:hypothetical protein